MIPITTLAINGLCQLNQITNRSFVLPLVIFYPTSRCNSRCISCDWWKSTGEDDLTLAEIERLAESLPALGTRVVLFSGGEPLLRKEIFQIAELFRRQGLTLWLLTSGLALARYAREVAHYFSRVTISLDASTPERYRAIRGVDGLAVIEAGVRQLKTIASALPVTARATLHKANFWELPQIVDKAREMGLDGVSFLAADVSSTAFGRAESPSTNGHLRLDHREVQAFAAVIERTAQTHREEFASGFIAESPEKLHRLPQYYAALLGQGDFPPVECNAPWVSIVIEADGIVRPCFFHRAVGNIREKPLDRIVREDLPTFRRQLDVAANPVCQRCVCTLKVGLRSRIW